jgi:uncharacterized protein YrrD
MLRSIRDLTGYSVTATDGQIGTVKTCFLDDSYWMVRYLVVDIGSWLNRHRVLISPVSITQVSSSTVETNLSRQQVRNSPEVDTHRPVSRQHEVELHRHFAWPYYWDYQTFHNLAPIPAQETAFGPEERIESERDREEREQAGEYESHLRDTEEMYHYRVVALDGEVGHVDDFIVQLPEWNVRHLVVHGGRLHGRKVLVEAGWVSSLSWDLSEVRLDMTTDDIKGAPDFDPAAPVNRAYEERLYDYYGRPKYWIHETQR